MQNSFQVKRDLDTFLNPNSALRIDFDGANKSLTRRTKLYEELNAEHAKQQEQEALATEAVTKDKAIMSLPTSHAPFEVITESEKGIADAIQANPPKEPDPVNPPKTSEQEFEEAVANEKNEEELRKAAGPKALDPEVASPGTLGLDQEVRPEGHWKDSGLPGSQLFETAEDAYKYFASVGDEFSLKLISGQNPEPGVIETTSPIEFMLTGMGGMGVMAVNQARRQTGKYLGGVATRTFSRYMKSFALGSPVEYLGTIAAEELAEDNPFVGIAAEVLFGVGTGVVTDLAVDAFRPTWNATLEKSIQKALYDKYSPDLPSRFNSANAAYDSYRPDIPSLGAKQQVAESSRFRTKVAAGDLRDPDTRAVYKSAIAEAKQADLRPDEASAVSTLDAKIAQLDAQKPISPDAPLAVQASEIVSPDADVIPKTGIPERLDSRAKVSESFISPEVDTIKGNAVKSKYYRGVQKQIHDDWYADFDEDVAFLFNNRLRAARKAGKPITGKAAALLQDEVRAATKIDYDTAIDAETWARLQQIDNNPWVAQTRSSYISGASGATGRYDTTPGQITMRKRLEGDTTSRYKYEDWDITDHLVFTGDGTNLVLRSDVPNAPHVSSRHAIPPKFVPTIDYPKVTGRSNVMNMLAAKFKYWGAPARKVFHGKGVRPDFPAADRLKVDTEIWSKLDNKYITVKMLPETEVDAVARLYGWNDDMVTGYSYSNNPDFNPPSRINVDGSSDHVVNVTPTEVLANREAKRVMDVTSPKWYSRQKRLPDASSGEPVIRDPKYYAMSGAVEAYSKQQREFLMQMFDLTSQRMGEGEKSKYYNAMLERIAVMRNEILKDIRVLDGTNYGPHAKRTYLAFGDMLAGTDRLGMTNRYSELQIRGLARHEYDLFTQGGPSDVDKLDSIVSQRMIDSGDGHTEAISWAKKQNLVGEYDRITAPEGVKLDPQVRSEAEGLADTSLRGRVIDTGSIEGAAVPRSSATGPATTDGIGRLIYDAEADTLNAQVIKLEDHFGVRIADGLWDVSSAGGTGKLNIWRINTLDDINGLFMRLDQPVRMPGSSETQTILSAAPVIDPKAMFGVDSSSRHTPEMTQRISMVLKDTQAQMDSLASELAEDPTDIPTAIAWAKLRAIFNVMSTSLVDGQASESSLKTLKSLNLYSNSDADVVKKVLTAANTAMPLGPDNLPNPKFISMQAEMMSEIPQRARKAGLLRRFDEVGGAELDDLYKSQRQLTEVLKEACL